MKRSILEKTLKDLDGFFRKNQDKSYDNQVTELRAFYEKRLQFASKFRLPGFEKEPVGDAGAATGDATMGIGADVALGVKYEQEINQAAKQHGLNPWFIASIIKKESNFDTNAGSGAGAKGLMQLMPGTADFLGVKNVHDPLDNVMGGTKYIKDMLKQFDWDPVMALAAYNAGPGNIGKFGGVPPFKETQDYVKKIPAFFKEFCGQDLTSETVKWQGEMKVQSAGGAGSISAGAAKAFINKWNITADYPRYPSGGWHSGIDFAGPGISGTPLPAFHSGLVTVAGWTNSGYGYYVVIKDGAGNNHYYAHLSGQPVVQAGQAVKVDQIIGSIGSTGNSSGPHLHYEVRPPSNIYKQAMNPRKFLKGTEKGI